jgi:hypothetical protein
VDQPLCCSRLAFRVLTPHGKGYYSYVSEILSHSEYVVALQDNVTALEARVRQTGSIASGYKQKDVLFYFLGRAIQIGKSCFLSQDLETPLYVLARVLCDDMFTMYWVSLSKDNAIEFENLAFSEKARYLKRNLANKRASVRHKGTGEDGTDKLIGEASRHIIPRTTIDKIAQNCQLGHVYDILFMRGSLYVHGFAYYFDPSYQQVDPRVAALSMIVSLLRVMLLIWDRPYGSLTAEDIRASLNVQRLTGT